MPNKAAAALLVTLALLSSSSAAFFAPRAQRLTLDAVLRRCEQYVLDYEPQVSRVVAREEYMQRLYVRNREDEPQSRRLVSDFLFLRLPGRRGSWLGIREVLEIDGVPANGRRRLDEAAAGATHAEIEALAGKYALENARYNLGGFVRTVNVPFVVLSWMHPGFRDRFDFDHKGVERIDGIDAWRIEFEEDERPTIIQTPEGDDVVSRGTIWIDPVTGRILQTELRNRPKPLAATIRVRFAWDGPLGIMVPVSMHERYTEKRGTLEGEATYSDFRQFDVLTKIK
jgi:hypothetical protein